MQGFDGKLGDWSVFGDSLAEKGLCVLDATELTSKTWVAEAERLPKRLHKASPVSREPKAKVAEGLLGQDTHRITNLASTEVAKVSSELVRLRCQMETLCGTLGGTSLEISEPWLLEARTPLAITVPQEEITEVSAEYWSKIFMQHKYQVLLFLGHQGGTLKLTAASGSALEVNTCPGALVILRPELWVSRSYSTTSRKRNFSVSSFLCGAAQKELPFYAQDLLDWCAARLEVVKEMHMLEDQVRLASVPSSWQRAANAHFAVGEQAAIKGICCRNACGWLEESLVQTAFVGADLVTEIPIQRFDVQQWCEGPEVGTRRTSCSRHGSFLEAAELFDHNFFGISAKQVNNMPVSERWGLEVGYEALFDAGYTKQSLRRLKGDVLVGIHAVENQLNFRTSESSSFGLGGSQAREANLLSFHLNLTGQSIVFDTDGSSSFAALHHAQMEQSAEQDEPREAGRSAPFSLVLSSFWNVSPACFVNFSFRGLLCRKGRCFSFNTDAEGFVRGEGSVALVLHRLFGAEEVETSNEGLIRAVEMKQSGVAVEASFLAIQELLDMVLARSYCRPSDVDLVECHAPGEVVADSMEAVCCAYVLREETSEPLQPLPMTSLKASIGSGYAAAGLLGLIRCLRCTRCSFLPANIMLRQMNVHLATEVEEGTALLFPTESVAIHHSLMLPTGLAIVNSFGSSGTNCAALLGVAPT